MYCFELNIIKENDGQINIYLQKKTIHHQGKKAITECKNPKYI